ncbi:hypothetical protein PI124_g11186 [Phytophthora idaei]|nr:hypothetical protein PI125_g2910 [Phytophthora idaei]KAG3244003.1 hypothetical protein PI124_g11186 [Phytophthora idaei]
MVSSLPRPFGKRTSLTKLQELQICARHRDLPIATYTDLASWAQFEFSLTKRPSKQVTGRLLKTESSLRRFTTDCLRRQRVRPRFQLLLDQCMVECVLAIDSWSLLPWSWLRNLQDRYGIRWRRAHGEDGLANLEPVQEEIKSLRNLIRTYSYTDVYNMDETGFFYNNVSRGSLCINAAPALKKDKARITLAVCTNAPGTDKLPLLFIGKSVKPRWLDKKT